MDVHSSTVKNWAEAIPLADLSKVDSVVLQNHATVATNELHIYATLVQTYASRYKLLEEQSQAINTARIARLGIKTESNA